MRATAVARLARLLVVCAATTAVLAVIPAPVSAAPGCASVAATDPVKVAAVPTWLESIIVDRKGRMFATDLYGGLVYRIDHPGATPKAITGDVEANGGIVVRPDGLLLVATGNDGISYYTPESEILLVDPDTGAVSTYADGLYGIDGLALGPDGAVYTSTLGTTTIGRVAPDGAVDPEWAEVVAPNGIAVSPDNRYLYVIQSTLAPVLFRIPIATPERPERWIAADPADALASPDGLTLDSLGRPLIATHEAGEIWRAEGGRFCAVQSDVPFSTQVTYGHGRRGFSAGHLYRTGVEGDIYEIPAGFDPGMR